MRLIDADALLNLPFEKMIHTDFGDTCVPIEEIEMAPTVERVINVYPNGEVIVQEKRPQGEWIIDGHHIRCNRCNEYICNTDREGNKIPDNFCPNCGADMNGIIYTENGGNGQ